MMTSAAERVGADGGRETAIRLTAAHRRPRTSAQLVPSEDAETREHLNCTDDEDDPSPDPEVVEDELRFADKEARTVDGGDAPDNVQRPEDDDHDAGEGQPALASACSVGRFDRHELLLLVCRAGGTSAPCARVVWAPMSPSSRACELLRWGIGHRPARRQARDSVPRPSQAMADQSDTSPPEGVPAAGSEPAASLQRSHRALVWSLIVLASVLLVVSMIANWVQREALDTDQVEETTDEILADEDVQQALSIYAGRSAVRQRRCPGRDRAEAAEQRQGAGRSRSRRRRDNSP